MYEQFSCVTSMRPNCTTTSFSLRTRREYWLRRPNSTPPTSSLLSILKHLTRLADTTTSTPSCRFKSCIFRFNRKNSLNSGSYFPPLLFPPEIAETPEIKAFSGVFPRRKRTLGVADEFQTVFRHFLVISVRVFLNFVLPRLYVCRVILQSIFARFYA